MDLTQTCTDLRGLTRCACASQALLNFAGCVVCVSHDRFFLDRLCTHILAAEGEGKWVWHEGNYEEYEASRIKRMGDDLPAPIKYATLV